MDAVPIQKSRLKAGFFSLLTFSWINNVLKLGSKQTLEEEHLVPIETSDQAEKLVGNKSTPMESLDEDGFLQRVYHYRAPQVMLYNNVESSSFATVVLPKGNFYSFRNQLQNDAADCLWYDCEHYSTISVL